MKRDEQRILDILKEKEMYGYEMIDTLAQRSNNVFELRAGSEWEIEKVLFINNNWETASEGQRKNMA